MDYSPVLISVYNRKEHLIRLINSLLNNNSAIHTDLFIVSDAPHNTENANIIEDIRVYASQIIGFKKVEIIAWKENKGSHKSILDSIKYLFNIYDKLIFLEDDNFVSSNFLDYMNQGLEKYEDNNLIFSFSGYNYPVSLNADLKKRYDLYLFSAFSAWGVGLWKRKWKEIDWNIDFKEALKNSLKNEKEMRVQVGDRVFTAIINMSKDEKPLIDVIVCYHLFFLNLKSVFPILSKVRNFGTDGFGEHSVQNNIYINQEIDDGNGEVDLNKIALNEKRINKIIYKYFRETRFKKFKFRIRTTIFS